VKSELELPSQISSVFTDTSSSSMSSLTRDKLAILFTENLLLKQELSLKEEEERRERERQRKDNQKSLLKEYQKLLASLN